MSFKPPLPQSSPHPTPQLFGGKVVLVLLDSGEGDELGHSPGNSSVGHDCQRAHKMSVVAWETNQVPGWLELSYLVEGCQLLPWCPLTIDGSEPRPGLGIPAFWG